MRELWSSGLVVFSLVEHVALEYSSSFPAWIFMRRLISGSGTSMFLLKRWDRTGNKEYRTVEYRAIHMNRTEIVKARLNSTTIQHKLGLTRTLLCKPHPTIETQCPHNFSCNWANCAQTLKAQNLDQVKCHGWSATISRMVTHHPKSTRRKCTTDFEYGI